jgi:hypothetical protein
MKLENENTIYVYIYMKPLSTNLVVTMTYTLPQTKNGTQFENGLGSSPKIGQIEIFVY